MFLVLEAHISASYYTRIFENNQEKMWEHPFHGSVVPWILSMDLWSPFRGSVETPTRGPWKQRPDVGFQDVSLAICAIFGQKWAKNGVNNYGEFWAKYAIKLIK